MNEFKSFEFQVIAKLNLTTYYYLFCLCFRAGLKSSLDEGTPAATVQEPDLGRVFDVAAYGK